MSLTFFNAERRRKQAEYDALMEAEEKKSTVVPTHNLQTDENESDKINSDENKSDEDVESNSEKKTDFQKLTGKKRG